MEMTTEEAIQCIEDDLRLHHEYLSGKYRHALRKAVAAMKEQAPVKPKYQSDTPYCGNCKFVLATLWNNCPYCGKEILWNDRP